VGRSITEIKRLLVALQTSDRQRVMTPAEWHPGDPVLTQPRRKGDDGCQAGFFCLRELPTASR
jgi:peroxiredoxin (alkyl hydroperoxide reductase subunit C)